MRKNIAKVIEAFKARKAAVGDSKRICWTNGEEIYSYQLLIARRMKNGIVVIFDAKSTRTTNSHIKALRVALAYETYKPTTAELS